MEKYIVYLTTNKVNNKIYIGVHKTLTPEVFDGYIGCGISKNKFKNAETPFQKAVIKYGYINFVRITLAVFESKAEAYNLEAELVTKEFCKRKDVYNVVPGGLITANEVQKRKVYKFDLNGNFLAEYESLALAARLYNMPNGSSIIRAIKQKQMCKGFLWNYENTIKYTYTDVVNKPRYNQRPILQFSIDGTFVREWESVSEVVKQFRNVKKVLNGTLQSTKGFKFTYKDCDIV